jgi:phage N-6-adenine-methyltransferase
MSEAYLPSEAKTVEHGTPPEIFDPLNAEFGFTLDAAATDENALCEDYYTAEEDGSAQDWAGHTVFCNPPYDAKSLQAFTQNVLRQAGNGVTTVMLVPSKTDQPWFHWLWDRYLDGTWRVEFRWVKGRVKFVGNKDTAPFPVVVIVVGPRSQ